MEKLVENIVYWIREGGKGYKDAGPEIVIDEQRMCDVLESTIFLEDVVFNKNNFVKNFVFSGQSSPKVKIAINGM